MKTFTEEEAGQKIGRIVRPSDAAMLEYVKSLEIDYECALTVSLGEVVGIEADSVSGWNVIVAWKEGDGGFEAMNKEHYEWEVEELS